MNNNDPYAENFYQLMAGMLELRARMDSIVETVGKEVIATKGNEEWQRLHALLEKSYREKLEYILLGIGDRQPGLSAVLQKYLDDASASQV